MIRLIQIALLLAIIIPLGMARADFYTGNDLHARCLDNRSFAVGYVTGLFDTAKVLELFDDKEVMKLCMPQGVLNGQLTDIVCKKLAENPKNRHSTANWLAFEAIQEAYPCPKEKKP